MQMFMGRLLRQKCLQGDGNSLAGLHIPCLPLYSVFEKDRRRLQCSLGKQISPLILVKGPVLPAGECWHWECCRCTRIKSLHCQLLKKQTKKQKNPLDVHIFRFSKAELFCHWKSKYTMSLIHAMSWPGNSRQCSVENWQNKMVCLKW